MIAIDTDVSPVSVTAATINPLPPEEAASLNVSAGVRETCHIWHLLRQCEVGGRCDFYGNVFISPSLD